MDNISQDKSVCLIVPMRQLHNRAAKCIDSFFNLSYPDLEIIFVDDGLKDDERDILEKHIKIRQAKILDSQKSGPSYARNLGARNTEASFIAFTDSDCIVDKNWLTELMRGFLFFPQSVACGGTQGLPDDATDFEKKIFLFMRKAGFITEYMREARGKKIREVNHNASCCVMYRREVFLNAGGFLEGLWPGEDVELDFRLKNKGYKIAFNPGAIVYHYRPQNLENFYRMMHRYGWSQGFLVRRYGIFRKIHFLPLITFISGIIFLAGLFYNSKIFAWAFVMLFSVILAYFSFDLYLLMLGLGGMAIWHSGFIKGVAHSRSAR